jgi:hypothetical protein
MTDKSAAVAAMVAATMLLTVFITTQPFSIKDAEGQILPSCPVGFQRDVLGNCVRIPTGTLPPATVFPPNENRTEQNIVCSGWSYRCG